MDMRTKFTQTKFKEPPPPPVPKRIKKRKKRCAPSVPDGETSEARTSAAFSPPRPPTPLKDFLTDITQEVAIAEPDDMIDHLAEYSLRLQTQLRERKEEEEAIRLLMEEKAIQLQKEDQACRVIQMAFRGFMARKAKTMPKSMENIVAKGVTVDEANMAAETIQRQYRRHNLEQKVRIKLMIDAARAAELPDIDMSCPFKRHTAYSNLDACSSNRTRDEEESVSALSDLKTPYSARGESFGVDPPCPMVALLLLQHSNTVTLSAIGELSTVTNQSSHEIKDPGKKTMTVLDTSATMATHGMGHAAVVSSGGQLGGEEGSTPGEPKGNEETEASTPSPALERTESGEEKPETADVPEEKPETSDVPEEKPETADVPEEKPETADVPETTEEPLPEPSEAQENPSGEEAKQDAAPPEGNAETTETPEAEN